MKVQEYRDLISSVCDKLASAKSAATEEEMDAECHALARLVKELESAECPRRNGYDLLKASEVIEAGREFACGKLMEIHDNQKLEKEYCGDY